MKTNDKGAIISSFLEDFKKDIQTILGVKTEIFDSLPSFVNNRW